MKRRTFLKTVGGATGAAALGTVSSPENRAVAGPGGNGRPAALTTSLEEVTDPKAPDSPSPLSNLRIRPPVWHPDGSTPDSSNRNQVFREEAVGKGKDQMMHSFPVEFEYKGLSKKWILGGPIVDPPPRGQTLITLLCRDLAIKMRKYNASLYRLRRIHYCNKFKDPGSKKHWPHANPDGGDEKDPTAGTASDVSNRVSKAEQDWCDVTKDIDTFIENAKTGYPLAPATAKIRLVGLDMVEVNNYAVAMRVVVETLPGAPPEVGESSSQVSISSPFSSTTP